MPPWPSPLLDAGYRIVAIDQAILLPPDLRIKPDVITLSDAQNNAILWECKSGRNLDVEQSKRYEEFSQKASARDVQRVAGVPFASPENARFEVAYCVMEEAVQDSVTVITSISPFPIVSLGEITRLVSGRFTDVSLDPVFKSGVPTPRLESVPWLIVADSETTDGELARYIIPTLVSLLLKQTQKATVSSILQQTLIDWACISLETQGALREKTTRILREVCAGELSQHLKFRKAQERQREPCVEVVSDVLSGDSSALTRGLQRLKALTAEIVTRLSEGRPYVEPPPESKQGELFSKNADGLATE